jgi:tyrosyl-DNA phosphodiesterase 1
MGDPADIIVLSSDDEVEDVVLKPPPKRGMEKSGLDGRGAVASFDDDGHTTKKPRTHAAARREVPRSAPIKLFATDLDLQARMSSSDPMHWSRSQCLTLREMLGYDGSLNGAASVEWMILSNFIVNFEFLLGEIPEILSIPRTVVFYGECDTPTAPWLSACEGRVEFRQLRPGDPPRSPTNPLRNTMSYGVHHTKAFLLGLSNGSLRVIIHTTNLRPEDLRCKAQAAYIQDFPLKAAPGTSAKPACAFENDLVAYFDSYGFTKRVVWGSGGPVETLSQRLRAYDYSTASAVLVPSIPGYHPATGPSLGHLKLRHALENHAQPSPGPGSPIVCQFSSIGSLNEKYLLELQRSMDTSQVPARGTVRRPWDKPAPSPAHRGGGSSANRLKLQLVYPTEREICTSVEGPPGGNSVPGRVKNLDDKAFLKPLMRKWSSASTPSGTSNNPLHKPRNVPHIKTYYQLGQDSQSMQWFVVSSHNLSMAAWGTVIHPQFCRPDARLMIRSWELGVFVSPSLLPGCTRLVPWTPEIKHRDGDVTVPLPFKLVPDSYGAGDVPWAVDRPMPGF